jgi:hypothetical protein
LALTRWFAGRLFPRPLRIAREDALPLGIPLAVDAPRYPAGIGLFFIQPPQARAMLAPAR